MDTPMIPEVGQVIQLEDEDYLYGDGYLVFSVAAVGSQYRDHKRGDVIWLRLSGYRVHPDGEPWGPQREISAKVGRIRLAPNQEGEPLPRKPPREAVPPQKRIPSHQI